jgi:HSP20 family protein
MEPFEDMDKFFESSKLKGFAPAVDVYETKDEVVVEMPLAGIDPKDVDISVENDVLVLKGQTKKESEVEDKNYYRKEICSGSFFRSVALPARVEAGKAEAESVDGMLKITFPKVSETKSKIIKIKTKK